MQQAVNSMCISESQSHRMAAPKKAWWPDKDFQGGKNIDNQYILVDKRGKSEQSEKDVKEKKMPNFAHVDRSKRET